MSATIVTYGLEASVAAIETAAAEAITAASSASAIAAAE